MKNLVFLIALFFVLPSNGQTAAEIIKKAEEKLRGKSSYAEMSITTVRPKWSREMMLKSWAKGSDLSLIYITAPSREKGTVFLKKKREVWNWIPNIERTIKLPPSMMSQSWMGTDLTNDDLVRESEKDNDFTHKILGIDTVNGYPCWKIESIPKEDAAVVWGKIISWIGKKHFITHKTEMYDEDLFLVNIMIASDIKQFANKFLPAKLEVLPVEKKGHKTVIQYVALKFDVPINDTFFSLQNMRKIK